MKITLEQLRVGSKVLLKADKKEGWREEPAEVLGLEGNGTIMVHCPTSQWPADGDPDGLREITVEQIKKILTIREFISLVDKLSDEQDEIVGE